MKKDALDRDINLAKLLMTPEQVTFQATHKSYYGIHDELGLESFIPIGDHFDVKSLEKINQRMRSLELRARFSSQRSAKVYICWVKKGQDDMINELCDSNKFEDARNLLTSIGVFV